MLGTSLGRFFPQLTHPLPTGSHFSIPVPLAGHSPSALVDRRGCGLCWHELVVVVWKGGLVVGLGFRSVGSYLRLGSAYSVLGRHDKCCPCLSSESRRTSVWRNPSSRVLLVTWADLGYSCEWVGIPLKCQGDWALIQDPSLILCLGGGTLWCLYEVLS